MTYVYIPYSRLAQNGFGDPPEYRRAIIYCCQEGLIDRMAGLLEYFRSNGYNPDDYIDSTMLNISIHYNHPEMVNYLAKILKK